MLAAYRALAVLYSIFLDYMLHKIRSVHIYGHNLQFLCVSVLNISTPPSFKFRLT